MLAGGDVVECHIAAVVSSNRFTGFIQDIAGATNRIAIGIRRLNGEVGCRLRNLERGCGGAVGSDGDGLRIRFGEIIAIRSSRHADGVLTRCHALECHIAAVVSSNRLPGLVQDIAGATDRVASGISCLDGKRRDLRLRAFERERNELTLLQGD